MMQQTLDRVKAAAVDGRAYNVFYRQRQLESLCRTLLDNAEKIRQAIISDYSHTPSEVSVEFHLAVTAVRNSYASLQPKKSHEEEYAVAHGKDAAGNRVPVGIVCIEPTPHTMFYSTIVPLSASIAAGNCVIVVLENDLRATPSLLRQLLPAALSSDTFAIVSAPITDDHVLSKSFHIKQNAPEIRWSKENEITSLPKSRSIAVVDRNANCQCAARELVNARFGFGGSSPYAPDVVIVNEFAKKDLLQAIVSECVDQRSSIEKNDPPRNPSTGSRLQEKIESLKQEYSDLRVIVQQDRLAVVDLSSRLEKMPKDKNTAPVLLICSMRSLDDGIDLLARSSSGPYLAAYHFSDFNSAKYLSQFIDARLTFINHVPRELLLGPTFPIGHPINLSERYPASLFELSRPVLITPSTQSLLLSSALRSSNASAAQQLWDNAVIPLAAMTRSKGGGVGFFEQGFLMNAALILTSTAAISSTGVWYLWKHARRG